MKLSHATLAVSDLEALATWYVQALGLTEVAGFGLDEYQLSGRLLAHPSGWMLELQHRQGAAVVPPVSHPLDTALTTGYGYLGYTVDDVAATAEALTTAGARQLMPAHPGPSGFTAYLADPEGNVLQVVTPYAEGERPPPPPRP